ncbi:hypothetical protein [Promicromonospora sp. NFX87]
MTHLALADIDAEAGVVGVEWGEQVSEAEYNDAAVGGGGDRIVR